MKRVNKVKKIVDVALVAAMLAACMPSLAESTGSEPPAPPAMTEGQPPERPSGDPGTPPEGMGTPPDGMTPPEGMGTPPDGMGTPPEGKEGPGGAPGGMGGGPGGMMGGSTQPESYDAVYAFDSDASLIGETVASTGADESAVLVTGGSVTVTDSEISRVSSDSTGGDSASFYGVGAAALVTGGTLTISGSSISTDSAGGAGVFAYGDGVAWVSDTAITTRQGTSGGIHVAGGGTLYARNVTAETWGASSAAIRSDRGAGTLVVEGGSYTSHGSGSPAVYVTADITITDAELTATGSEALCLEGLNTVRLYNCDLSGAMPDDSQNDNTWTVILYQSMSGDAQVGQGSFLMEGGSLVSANGGLFYTTNTESVFTLRNVAITAADDCEYFLRVTGNSNQRGWGSAGANGADCVFTAYEQVMTGDVVYDSISNLNLSLLEGTVWTGAAVNDESCAGNGGSGTVTLTIDETSSWVMTADSSVHQLNCAGTVVDSQGRAVTILGTDGTVYVQGDSELTLTVTAFSAEVGE